MIENSLLSICKEYLAAEAKLSFHKEKILKIKLQELNDKLYKTELLCEERNIENIRLQKELIKLKSIVIGSIFIIITLIFIGILQ